MTFSEPKGYRFGVVFISEVAAFLKCWFETPEAFWGLMDFIVRAVWMHFQAVFRMALRECFWSFGLFFFYFCFIKREPKHLFT